MSLTTGVKSQLGELENEIKRLRESVRENNKRLDELGEKVRETESATGLPKTKDTRSYIDKRVQKWAEQNLENIFDRYVDASGLGGLDDGLGNLSNRVSRLSESLDELKERETETRETVNGIIDDL